MRTDVPDSKDMLASVTIVCNEKAGGTLDAFYPWSLAAIPWISGLVRLMSDDGTTRYGRRLPQLIGSLGLAG